MSNIKLVQIHTSVITQSSEPLVKKDGAPLATLQINFFMPFIKITYKLDGGKVAGTTVNALLLSKASAAETWLVRDSGRSIIRRSSTAFM